MNKKNTKSSFLRVFSKIIISIFAVIIILFLGLILAYQISDKTTGKITVAGEQREYLLYVPQSYDPETPTPLIINIHGFSQWPANQMKVSQWNDLADQDGFIVVYPSGTGFPKRWRVLEDNNEPGGPQKELAYFAMLIDTLSSQYNIDPTRIYASGLSNGGGMTVLLACQLSEKIAAIGGVAGAYLVDMEKCSPDRPVPAIFFHGMADKIVPYYGGPSERFELPFPNIPDWVSGYAKLNQCTQESKSIIITNSITSTFYSHCVENSEVVFYMIKDGGHTWPGGNALPERIAGKTTSDIDATSLMWEFFQKHPLKLQ